VPLILLCIQFGLKPYFLSTASKTQPCDWRALSSQERIHIGRYRGHEIHLALFDLERDPSLFPDSQASVLFLSHFIVNDGITHYQPAPSRAVHRRLSEYSLNLKKKFANLLHTTVKKSPGDALFFWVDPQEKFPFKMVCVLIFGKEDGPDKIADQMRDGVRKSISVIDNEGFDSLVLPMLTVNPGIATLSDYKRVFRVILESLPQGGLPSEIVFSVYKNLETVQISKAADGVCEGWQELLTEAGPLHTRISDLRTRQYLLFLFVCLLVSSFYTKLTLRNAIVIAVAYTTVAEPASAVVASLGSSFFADLSFYATIAVHAFVAVSLGWIVHLNPKDVFGKKKGE